jgi:hypothetical protein
MHSSIVAGKTTFSCSEINWPLMLETPKSQCRTLLELCVINGRTRSLAPWRWWGSPFRCSGWRCCSLCSSDQQRKTKRQNAQFHRGREDHLQLFGNQLAVDAGEWPDTLISALALVGFSIPVFWLALLFTLFFSLTLGWFIPTGMPTSSAKPNARMHSSIVAGKTTFSCSEINWPFVTLFFLTFIGFSLSYFTPHAPLQGASLWNAWLFWFKGVLHAGDAE